MTTETENTGWGGRRKGSGAKRTLPEGARTRSINMTDEELLKVKKVLNELRRNKMFKLYGMKDVKKVFCSISRGARTE